MHICISIYSVVMGVAVVMKCVRWVHSADKQISQQDFITVMCFVFYQSKNVCVMHKCIGTFWSMSAAQ